MKKKKKKAYLKPYYFDIFLKKGKTLKHPRKEKRGRNFYFFWGGRREERAERERSRASRKFSHALLFARALFFVPRVFHRFRSSRRANTVLPPPVSTPEERRGKGEGEKRDATQQRTKTWEEKRKGGKEI